MPARKTPPHFINGVPPLFHNLALIERAGPRRRRKPLRNEPDTALRHLLAELVDARRRAHLGQRHVAQRLCTTVSAISRLECGRRSRPTLTTLENYAMVIGCRLEIHIRTR
jgi:hypothetical protein